MKRRSTTRDQERGVIILLVAFVLLFIVTAFAALAIDLVTFYTARSEAQLAADGAALAGARVLANSGVTSDSVGSVNHSTLVANTEALATAVATQVATSNKVGGRNLTSAEVGPISFNTSDPTNPQVTVQVQRADLPTFFARIWGRTQVAVSASATAEAYNPSGHGNNTPPVALTCVKPWLLPNINPNGGGDIFDTDTGGILGGNLLGTIPAATGTCGNGLCVACPSPIPTQFCRPGMTVPAWQYYPGSQTDFPAPTQALPACSAGFAGANKAYQLSIAGCVQQPIRCGKDSGVTLDSSVDGSSKDAATADAVTCLTTHTNNNLNNQADKIDPPPPAAQPPGQPFQFLAGDDNPVVDARGHDVLVSSSLVTFPVVEKFDTSPVKVIGFIQVFLNPSGVAAASGAPAEVVNLVGCGKDMAGTPILGNGASPVAVRLISR